MRQGFSLRYKLEALGNEASESYLRGNGSLNEVVTKVANDNNLEPEEVVRVCEAANKATFLNLFETEEDKTFEFPLADSKEILAGINKSASDPIDMDSLEGVLTDSRRNDELSQILPPQEVEKFASDNLTVQFDADDPSIMTREQLTQNAFEKLAFIADELRSEYLSSKFKAEAAVDDFVKCAKQEILDSGSAGTINKIGEFLATARPDNVGAIDHLMRKVASVMHIEHHWSGKGQLEKAAAEVAPDLFSETLSIGTQPVQVINGDNPMIRALDTTIEQVKEVDRNGGRYYEVRDQVKYLRGKVYENIDREQKVGA